MDEAIFAQAWMLAYTTYYAKHAKKRSEYNGTLNKEEDTKDWKADLFEVEIDGRNFADHAVDCLTEELNKKSKGEKK